MKITVQPQGKDKIVLFEKLLELYAYDFSKYTKADIDENGEFGFKRMLQKFWTTDNPDPMVIRANEKIAGFIMVIQDSSGTSDYQLKEFFILSKYRRKGIGQVAATKAIKMFPGKWRLTILSANSPAIEFWYKTLQRLDCTNLEQKHIDNSGKIEYRFQVS